MTFEDLKKKYPEREPAFPIHLPRPNAKDLNELIAKYECKYPNSFIDFQLKYCLEIPIGDYSFDGFGFASKELDPVMNLEEILKDYAESNYPNYLTPFRQQNGDYWCFDNRSPEAEFQVIVFDHNSNEIEPDPKYKWKNFIDWLNKTMEDEY